MNSKNSKTSKPHVLILDLTDKIDLKRREKSIASSNRNIYHVWYMEKHEKSYKRINLKYQLLLAMMNLNYQMDHVLYQIVKIILSIF